MGVWLVNAVPHPVLELQAPFPEVTVYAALYPTAFTFPLF